ncbi:hcf-1 protein [Thysanoplusia orichalcea nucleopolyhedrovirus]|uniref:Hcf-1 protein n=1 Tax=Thysanoplusia orichalcea nucleopolyhedrovirus TaxID=101850 RepID=L0CLU3_9ABAC|nr:hcf-1 protein [Thysanoplusia orichalcea nucleopolyhedrovirus]AGA16221.1 hcf-1 protein [Thysanoplusia orichalcea nucleopolyhedrovirus]
MDSLLNLCLKILPSKVELPRVLSSQIKQCNGCHQWFLPKFIGDKCCGRCTCDICHEYKINDCLQLGVSTIKPQSSNKEIYIFTNRTFKTCKNECRHKSKRKCLVTYFNKNEKCFNSCCVNKRCYMCLEYKQTLHSVNLYVRNGKYTSYAAFCFSCIKNRIKVCQMCDQPLLKMYKQKQEERLKTQSLYKTMADQDLKVFDLYDTNNYTGIMVLCAQCHIFSYCVCTFTIQCYCPRLNYECECFCRQSKYFKNNVLCIKSKQACFNKFKIRRIPKIYKEEYKFKRMYKLINIY